MELEFQGSITSLSRKLKSIRFRFKTVTDGRKFFMESTDNVTARVTFLRKIHNIRHP